MDNLVLWAQELWDLYIRDFLLYLGVLFIIIESVYQRLKILWQPKYQEHGRWQDEIGPMIVAIVVVLSLWPITIFDFLPFKPSWQFFCVVWTVFICARASSGAHELFKRIVEMANATATRIAGWSSKNNRDDY